MTEEEKEAIEETRLVVEHFDDENYIISYRHENLNVLLNLIDKLQQIIKKQSYTNKKLRNKIKTVRKERNKLQKENQELKEENEKINKAADKMYEYISYYGWEDFESNTGCNREEMVDYFYKE